MLLTPTEGPSYLDVVKAARDGATVLPAPLAHLLLILATRYPEMRPTGAMLASNTGSSVRTVERNLRQLTERGWLVSLSQARGVERGGVSYRFLVLPTLSRIGDPPVLVGRGPSGWEPVPMLVKGTDLPTLTSVDGPTYRH
jgi:hypothetical protein